MMEQINVENLIAALELHLTPRTDPNHCENCPYDTDPSVPFLEEKEIPTANKECFIQTTCEEHLIRDCLDILKQLKTQITMLEHSVMAAVKDFIQYFVDVVLPEQYAGTNEDYIIGKTAFDLGVAFNKWQNLWMNDTL